MMESLHPAHAASQQRPARPQFSLNRLHTGINLPQQVLFENLVGTPMPDSALPPATPNTPTLRKELSGIFFSSSLPVVAESPDTTSLFLQPTQNHINEQQLDHSSIVLDFDRNKRSRQLSFVFANPLALEKQLDLFRTSAV